MPATKPATLTRPISEIAWEIRQTWAKVNFAAEPYLAAMATLSDMEDRYHQDPADDVVRYFLSNATTWRGEDARRLKGELNAALAHLDKHGWA